MMCIAAKSGVISASAEGFEHLIAMNINGDYLRQFRLKAAVLAVVLR